MGRGLGPAQRKAIELLTVADRDNHGLFIHELTEQLGLSARRTHQIVESLRERELIWTRLTGWKEGQYEVGTLSYWHRPDPDRWSHKERVDADTPGARRNEWGYWVTPSGTPRRSMVVFLGNPPSTMFGPLNRHGKHD